MRGCHVRNSHHRSTEIRGGDKDELIDGFKRKIYDQSQSQMLAAHSAISIENLKNLISKKGTVILAVVCILH